jgi:hypothetical protein
MASPTVVFTIASANYLPYVKTLMQSVQDTNPDYIRYLVLADKKPLHEIACGDLYHVIEADQLGISAFDDMVLRYDVMEFNTAIKPFAIDWLFENTGAANVIYLDPDIKVYRELTELNAALDDGAAAVVTPHLTRPLEDSKSPNDYHMLQAGVFNLGFIALTRDPEAREFVRWWSRRLETQCYADVARNLFTDQRWVDLAPCYIGNLKVLRSPAYNVAYWNLAQREIAAKGSRIAFDGVELAFFHFSGLDRNRETVVSKHQDRFEWKDIKPLHNLFKNYRSALAANGWLEAGSTPYHYDFVDGIKLAGLKRRLYARLYPETQTSIRLSAQDILALCNQSAGLAGDDDGLITALMHQAYLERPDLQAAFGLTTADGRAGFRNWFVCSAAREYGLDGAFVDPTKISLAPPEQLPPPMLDAPHPNAGKPWHYRKWRKVRKWLIDRGLR